VSGDDNVPLTELAGAILDGAPVDWAAADSGATSGDRCLVRHLKAIAVIARAHRADTPDTWGPLRLLERIGRGAFGDVYRAWDPRLDREVALKLLPADPSSSNQLSTSIIDEGRLLARIRHPNVVTVYGAERIDDSVGLWMEYVDGRTLHQLVVEDGRRFSPREVAAIGQALCGAVAAVHAAGLLHLDIKAQNVMMDRAGRVVLMDFGSGRDRTGTSDADLAGTPLYLAPEVLTAASSPSIQSDIYSIGVLLFFLLTGSYPVTGVDLPALREAHERVERRSLKALAPGVPRRLLQSVERAIDPEPAHRPASAQALAAALGHAPTARGKTMAAGLAAAALVSAALVLARWTSPAPARGDRTQIAVLPIVTLTADAGGAQFAEGLTAEIVRNLGVVRDLDVRTLRPGSATDSARRSIGDVGRQLGVGYVLDGAVARAGGRLRVDARLVQVDGEVPVWSEQYERELSVTALLSIQDEISRAIVHRLRLSLDPQRRRYTTNLENYENYLRARALVEQQGVSGPLQAIKLFERIVASDPGYAPAQAGLVLAYAYLSMNPYQGVPFEKAHPVMRAAAIEALRLDPMLPEAYAARGWVHAREFEWQEADRAFRRAIELNPGLVCSYTSFAFSTLQPLGRVGEAERLLREAERIDPLDEQVQLALARVLLQAHRPLDAIAILEPLRRPDSLPMGDLYLGRALALDGRAAEALPLLERRRERLVDPASAPHPWVAWAYVKLGRRAEAERLAQDNDRLPFRRAIINAALGRTDRMFDGLEEMAEREPQRLAHLLRAPEFALYQDDERFARLLRRLNLDAR
jgi:eukaryotic-like serine/threonine-protein kinase